MSVVYSSDLDSVTNNTTPSGWSAVVGAFVAQDSAGGARPVSGAQAVLSQATDGNLAVYTGISALADLEFQTSHKVNIISSDASLMHHLLRSDSTFSNGYRVAIVYSGGNYSGVLLSNVAGSVTNHGSGTGSSFAVTHGDTVFMVTKIVGSTIDLFLWKSTGSRPGTPTYTWTNAVVSAAGYVGLWNSPGSTGASGSFDDFIIDDLASGAATATTLSGPSSGTVSVASTNFMVGANGTITGTVTVTPGDAGNGGTFTPTTVAISSGTPTATFTYTPASTGVKTISISDDGGLTDATSISYTSNAAASTYAPNINKPRSGMGTHFYGAR